MVNVVTNRAGYYSLKLLHLPLSAAPTEPDLSRLRRSHPTSLQALTSVPRTKSTWCGRWCLGFSLPRRSLSSEHIQIRELIWQGSKGFLLHKGFSCFYLYWEWRSD